MAKMEEKGFFGEHCVTINVPDCFEELHTLKSEGMWADLQPIGISFFFMVRSAIKADICFEKWESRLAEHLLKTLCNLSNKQLTKREQQREVDDFRWSFKAVDLSEDEASNEAWGNKMLVIQSRHTLRIVYVTVHWSSPMADTHFTPLQNPSDFQ